ncbi:Protein kinase domain containing protein, partial [Aphelenchoides avenae]
MSSSGSVPKPKLELGGIIGGQWKVLSELGSGGCGVVYRVERVADGLQAALKAETVDEKYTQTLKAETHVMRRMQWSEHVCRLFMAGRLSPTANAVVMSLVGRSVSWLRRQCPNQRFSLSTAVRVSLVCLNALEDLHSIGYIHRDVKASNFTIGLPPNQRKIHLLDFGFARSYLEWNQEGVLVHRRARTRAPFMGTDRYCSLNVHNRLEQSRRDDLFSFLFMIVELVEGRLPWRNCRTKHLVETK